MCTAHRSAIEDLVLRLVEAADGAVEAPDNGNLIRQEFGEGNGEEKHDTQEALDDPPPPDTQEVFDNPPPPILPPIRPGRQPSRGGRGRGHKEHPVIPPVSRHRGTLAMPVAPLPTGLALGPEGRPVTLNGDHRLQRQQVVHTLNRLSREESSMALQRRVKITMWTSVVFRLTRF